MLITNKNLNKSILFTLLSKNLTKKTAVKKDPANFPIKIAIKRDVLKIINLHYVTFRFIPWYVAFDLPFTFFQLFYNDKLNLAPHLSLILISISSECR